jgi:heme/copper-type cytochrome/quinol oxidase subunit 2
MLSSSVFTLSNTTPTLIVSKSVNPQEVTVHNMTKSSNQYIHIGPSTVTTTNSIHIDPGETLTINLASNDDLWAVSDPTGLVVGVLAVRTL